MEACDAWPVTDCLRNYWRRHHSKGGNEERRDKIWIDETDNDRGFTRQLLA